MQWYVDNKILFIQYWGEVTVDDLRRQIELNNRYIDESDAPLVHMIIDVSQITQPASMKDLTAALAGFKPHPRGGWTITVGEKDPLTKFVSYIGRQLFRLRQRSFETFQQAVDFLKFMDTTIDWSKADRSTLMNTQETGEPNHDH
jgi:hypothetical protein